MRRLLLIHPTTRSRAAGFGQTGSWGLPPLALAYVAALTPKDWCVRIIDEYIEDLNLAEPADLVGITSYSCNAPRAYDLAREFRNRGTPVVLGGIHVSMVAEEASRYADAVVIGEAESVWQTVISDFERGCLKREYRGKRLTLDHLPVPRRDLFSARYEMDVIQTTRGCPFNCEFCSVTAFNGNEYRQRPVEEVLGELAGIRKKVVYFVDDNFFGVGNKGRQRALDLLRGMIQRKMGKIWITQASLNIAEDEEVLKCAQRSGCRGLYIGFESVVPDSLREMRKGVNIGAGVDGYMRAIRRIHNCGICVIGAFIFGSDHDDIDVFGRTLDFMKSSGLDVPQLGFLTPFPGTGLHDRMSSEQRLVYNNFPDDWEKYDTDHVVFRPKAIDAVDLVRGFDFIAHSRFGGGSVMRQALKTLMATRSVTASILAHSLNRDSATFYNFEKRFTTDGS